jgi:hypothetical protein
MPRKSLPGSPLNSPRTVVRKVVEPRVPMDPNGTYPASRHELMPIAMASMILGFLALMVAASRGWMLLYGDAVAHLGIARRIFDARYPGLAQLGGVWLPLPHLLMAPFAMRTEWWQNGLAGAWPSLVAYVFANTGCYALARKLMPVSWAFAATAFFALNPNLLYLSTTAMTEPLFLALLLWSTIVAIEAAEALSANKPGRANARFIASGLLTLAMVFTRYDGWIVGAVIWIVLALAWWRSTDKTKAATKTAFITMTVLALAGPLLWFAYNAVYEGDWLDFMRGPYSAAAIEKKTTPLGSKPRRGWHNPGWAFLYYSRAAQVDAVAYELGFGVAVAALAGAWLLWKKRLLNIALLLWLPLPFYVYSIAWGNVPLFIPQMYPGSYYNSRYGIEMLPALTIFAALVLVVVERRLRAKSVKYADTFFFLVLASIVFNTVAMMGFFGTMMGRVRGDDAKVPKWLSAPPLVYEEGVVNSTSRIPFEQTIAKEMMRLGTHQVIMFNTNDHIGAVQMAGVSLRSLVSPLDSQSFDKAKVHPAKYANLIIAIDGDPVAKAVEANKDGLEETEVVCNSGQGCARFYTSRIMTEVPR